MQKDFSYSPDYAEYITPIARDGKYAVRKLLIVVGDILALILSFVLFTMKPQLGFFALVIIFAIAYLSWVLWKYTRVEYEYYIAQGEMQFDVIYSARTRKHLYDCKISKMSKVGKLSEYTEKPGTPVISAISKKSPDSSYYAVVEKETGGEEILLFEANEKILKIMKSFNAKAFF